MLFVYTKSNSSLILRKALEQRAVDEAMLISEMEVTGKAFDTLQAQNGMLVNLVVLRY
jgi:hypothetical protein